MSSAMNDQLVLPDKADVTQTKAYIARIKSEARVRRQQSMGARDGRLQNESSSLEESKTRDNSSPVHRVTRMDDLELSPRTAPMSSLRQAQTSRDMSDALDTAAAASSHRTPRNRSASSEPATDRVTAPVSSLQRHYSRSTMRESPIDTRIGSRRNLVAAGMQALSHNPPRARNQTAGSSTPGSSYHRQGSASASHISVELESVRCRPDINDQELSLYHSLGESASQVSRPSSVKDGDWVREPSPVDRSRPYPRNSSRTGSFVGSGRSSSRGSNGKPPQSVEALPGGAGSRQLPRMPSRRLQRGNSRNFKRTQLSDRSGSSASVAAEEWTGTQSLSPRRPPQSRERPATFTPAAGSARVTVLAAEQPSARNAGSAGKAQTASPSPQPFAKGPRPAALSAKRSELSSDASAAAARASAEAMNRLKSMSKSQTESTSPDAQAVARHQLSEDRMTSASRSPDTTQASINPPGSKAATKSQSISPHGFASVSRSPTSTQGTDRRPKESPKASPKSTTKSTPKASPKSPPKATPKSTPKVSPKSESKSTPKASPKAPSLRVSPLVTAASSSEDPRSPAAELRVNTGADGGSSRDKDARILRTLRRHDTDELMSDAMKNAVAEAVDNAMAGMMSRSPSKVSNGVSPSGAAGESPSPYRGAGHPALKSPNVKSQTAAQSSTSKEEATAPERAGVPRHNRVSNAGSAVSAASAASSSASAVALEHMESLPKQFAQLDNTMIAVWKSVCRLEGQSAVEVAKGHRSLQRTDSSATVATATAMSALKERSAEDETGEVCLTQQPIQEDSKHGPRPGTADTAADDDEAASFTTPVKPSMSVIRSARMKSTRSFRLRHTTTSNSSPRASAEASTPVASDTADDEFELTRQWVSAMKHQYQETLNALRYCQSCFNALQRTHRASTTESPRKVLAAAKVGVSPQPPSDEDWADKLYNLSKVVEMVTRSVRDLRRQELHCRRLVEYESIARDMESMTSQLQDLHDVYDAAGDPGLDDEAGFGLLAVERAILIAETIADMIDTSIHLPKPRKGAKRRRSSALSAISTELDGDSDVEGAPPGAMDLPMAPNATGPASNMLTQFREAVYTIHAKLAASTFSVHAEIRRATIEKPLRSLTKQVQRAGRKLRQLTERYEAVVGEPASPNSSAAAPADKVLGAAAHGGEIISSESPSVDTATRRRLSWGEHERGIAQLIGAVREKIDECSSMEGDFRKLQKQQSGRDLTGTAKASPSKADKTTRFNLPDARRVSASDNSDSEGETAHDVEAQIVHVTPEEVRLVQRYQRAVGRVHEALKCMRDAVEGLEAKKRDSEGVVTASTSLEADHSGTTVPGAELAAPSGRADVNPQADEAQAYIANKLRSVQETRSRLQHQLELVEEKRGGLESDELDATADSLANKVKQATAAMTALEEALHAASSHTMELLHSVREVEERHEGEALHSINTVRQLSGDIHGSTAEIERKIRALQLQQIESQCLKRLSNNKATLLDMRTSVNRLVAASPLYKHHHADMLKQLMDTTAGYLQHAEDLFRNGLNKSSMSNKYSTVDNAKSETQTADGEAAATDGAADTAADAQPVGDEPSTAAVPHQPKLQSSEAPSSVRDREKNPLESFNVEFFLAVGEATRMLDCSEQAYLALQTRILRWHEVHEALRVARQELGDTIKAEMADAQQRGEDNFEPSEHALSLVGRVQKLIMLRNSEAHLKYGVETGITPLAAMRSCRPLTGCAEVKPKQGGDEAAEADSTAVVGDKPGRIASSLVDLDFYVSSTAAFTATDVPVVLQLTPGRRFLLMCWNSCQVNSLLDDSQLYRPRGSFALSKLPGAEALHAWSLEAHNFPLRQAQYTALIARLKTTSLAYRAQVKSMKESSMKSVPKNVGMPLRASLLAATSCLRTPFASIPSAAERSSANPTQEWLTQFEDVARNSTIRVQQFGKALVAAQRAVRIFAPTNGPRKGRKFQLTLEATPEDAVVATDQQAGGGQTGAAADGSGPVPVPPAHTPRPPQIMSPMPVDDDAQSMMSLDTHFFQGNGIHSGASVMGGSIMGTPRPLHRTPSGLGFVPPNFYSSGRGSPETISPFDSASQIGPMHAGSVAGSGGDSILSGLPNTSTDAMAIAVQNAQRDKEKAERRAMKEAARKDELKELIRRREDAARRDRERIQELEKDLLKQRQRDRERDLDRQRLIEDARREERTKLDKERDEMRRREREVQQEWEAERDSEMRRQRERVEDLLKELNYRKQKAERAEKRRRDLEREKEDLERKFRDLESDYTRREWQQERFAKERVLEEEEADEKQVQRWRDLELEKRNERKKQERERMRNLKLKQEIKKLRDTQAEQSMMMDEMGGMSVVDGGSAVGSAYDSASMVGGPMGYNAPPMYPSPPMMVPEGGMMDPQAAMMGMGMGMGMGMQPGYGMPPRYPSGGGESPTMDGRRKSKKNRSPRRRSLLEDSDSGSESGSKGGRKRRGRRGSRRRRRKASPEPKDRADSEEEEDSDDSFIQRMRRFREKHRKHRQKGGGTAATDSDDSEADKKGSKKQLTSHGSSSSSQLPVALTQQASLAAAGFVPQPAPGGLSSGGMYARIDQQTLALRSYQARRAREEAKLRAPAAKAMVLMSNGELKELKVRSKRNVTPPPIVRRAKAGAPRKQDDAPLINEEDDDLLPIVNAMAKKARAKQMGSNEEDSDA